MDATTSILSTAVYAPDRGAPGKTQSGAPPGVEPPGSTNKSAEEVATKEPNAPAQKLDLGPKKETDTTPTDPTRKAPVTEKPSPDAGAVALQALVAVSSASAFATPPLAPPVPLPPQTTDATPNAKPALQQPPKELGLPERFFMDPYGKPIQVVTTVDPSKLAAVPVANAPANQDEPIMRPIDLHPSGKKPGDFAPPKPAEGDLSVTGQRPTKGAGRVPLPAELLTVDQQKGSPKKESAPPKPAEAADFPQHFHSDPLPTSPVDAVAKVAPAGEIGKATLDGVMRAPTPKPAEPVDQVAIPSAQEQALEATGTVKNPTVTAAPTKVKAKASEESSTTSTPVSATAKTDGATVASTSSADSADEAPMGNGKPDADKAETSTPKPSEESISVNLDTSKPVSASSTVAAPIGLPKPQTQAVIRQLTDRIEFMAAAKPKDGIVIHLQPSELGSVSMVVKTAGKMVDAQIFASNSNVREALEQSKSQLAESVQHRGYQLNAVTVGAQAQNSGNSQHSNARQAFEGAQQQMARDGHQNQSQQSTRNSSGNGGVHASQAEAAAVEAIPSLYSLGRPSGVDYAI